ncbi:hypothetical protein SAMN06893096_106229 [Geodermatophilus pulveris]|uniref:NADAR domain-containing protein n=1 Tax=Geodermatophilus pulveris TaxID=1564159 RepID=A0A239GK36_9ACTN|nr:NADAR family protein [Geodermatophilus pulveris]SNS69128.1 hypothetical protein SAMN06893096_106229 [Geodermatophilus pulveris]
MDELRFFAPDEEFFEFTNFAPFPVLIEGLRWPTTEHYFQAAKFADAGLRERIRTCPSPRAALDLARQLHRHVRRDWMSVRVDVMRTALRAKFTQHPALGVLLVGTGDARLVEASPRDSFWGRGPRGTGANVLGLLLVELRSELAASTAADPADPVHRGGQPGAADGDAS